MITKSNDYTLGWIYHDNNRVRMPWYSLPCLEWLDKQTLEGANVFEYGLGFSTQWFLSRGAFCWGVDSNTQWGVSSSLNHIYTHNKEKYISAINAFNRYTLDYICIDGLYRDDCTEYALKRLNKGGYLICDNWLQAEVEPYWPKSQELTKDLPATYYKQADHPHWVTVVFQKA